MEPNLRPIQKLLFKRFVDPLPLGASTRCGTRLAEREQD
jgi:hypothetical protein